MKGIAWDYLSPIQRSQLQATRPDLHLGVPQCQRCHNGQVVSGSCIQCGAEVDENGELTIAQSAKEIRALYGNIGRHNKVFIQ